MKYESEDFETLKQHVEELMKKGPMGDIYLYFFLKPYPYNQTGNVLDTLRFADVRKMLINFLCGVSRSNSPEARNQTNELIREIREYGYPDRQEEDCMKSLAWKLCDTAKSVDYDEWEARRQPGESEADVVRRTYQQMRIPEYCTEQLEVWQEYAECRHLKYEKEIQVAELIVDLQGLFPSLPKSELSKEELMLKCRRQLNMFHFRNFELYYLLAAENDGIMYNGVAGYGPDLICFSPFDQNASFVSRGDSSVDNYLLNLLENGYEISFMTMEGHAAVWYELGILDISAVVHREGLEHYFLYCKENDITAYTIKEIMGYMPPDLIKDLELQERGCITKNGLQKKKDYR